MFDFFNFRSRKEKVEYGKFDTGIFNKNSTLRDRVFENFQIESSFRKFVFLKYNQPYFHLF